VIKLKRTFQSFVKTLIILVMLFFSLLVIPHFTFASSVNYKQSSIIVGKTPIKLNILTIPDNGEYDFLK
jgi:hypothetical protein